MKKITIRQCPSWGTIRAHAASLAATLRKEPDVQIEVVDGSSGELTVDVDGRTVARKSGDSMPTADQVRTAMKKAKPAAM